MALARRAAETFLVMSVFTASLPVLAATYKYTVLNPAGWAYSDASAVNRRGQVVGSFTDTNDNVHGFTWLHGVITQYDAPGADSTVLIGINDSGIAVGETNVVDGDFPYLFTLDTATGETTDLTTPIGYEFHAYGIDDAGVAIGLASYAGKNLYSRTFRQSPKKTDFLRKGYTVNSISPNGQVVGNSVVDGRTSAFIFKGGKYTTIDLKGVTLTSPLFITNDGDYGGEYLTPKGHTYGFATIGGITSVYDVPKSVFTVVVGLGADKEVVGTYMGVDAKYHGFVALNGSYYTIDVPGGGSTTIDYVSDKSTLVGIYTLPSGGYGNAFIAECDAVDRLCTQ